jgi:Skp family chaperone for outer membrane proteins
MRATIAVAAATLVLAAVCATGWGAGVNGIAVVDMEELVKAHPKADSSRAVLRKQAEEFETEQKAMRAEYERLKKEFDAAREESDNEALSEAKRREKAKGAEEKFAALREYERKFRDTMTLRQQESADQRMRMRKQIVGDISETIRQYAQKHDLALVLDSASLGLTGSETVIYSRDSVDITGDILKLIGASDKTKEPAKSKEPEKAKEKTP